MTGGAGFSSTGKGANAGNRNLVQTALGKYFKGKDTSKTHLAGGQLNEEELAQEKLRLQKQIESDLKERRRAHLAMAALALAFIALILYIIFY